MFDILQKVFCWIGAGWALLGIAQMLLNLFSGAEDLSIAFTIVGCMLLYVIPGGILFMLCKPKESLKTSAGPLTEKSYWKS